MVVISFPDSVLILYNTFLDGCLKNPLIGSALISLVSGSIVSALILVKSLYY